MKVKQFLKTKKELAKPIDGKNGLSAYEIWLSQGNVGTEKDFLNSLKGESGDTIINEVVHEVIKEQPIIKTEIIKEIIKEVPIKAKDGEDGEDGISINSANVDNRGDLIIKYSDGKVENAGHVQGRDGRSSGGGGTSRMYVDAAVSKATDNLVHTIVAGSNISVDSTDPANPIVTATAGGGSVTAFSFLDGNGFTGTVTNSTTTPQLSLTYDSSGFVPYTGATGDVNIGTHSLITHSVKADATDGLILESANGTDVGILGAANTANVTWYGNHNFNNQTADTIAGFSSSKTLSSLTLSDGVTLSTNTIGLGNITPDSVSTGSASTSSVTISSVTANSLIYANGSKVLASVTTYQNGLAFSAGTLSLYDLINTSVDTGGITAVNGNIGTLVLNTTALDELYGGTGQLGGYSKGSTLVGSGINALTILAGNASTTRKYLSQIGDGSFNTSTSWEALTGSSLTGFTDTQIPYGNSSGGLSSEAAFIYDATTNTFTADNMTVAGSFLRQTGVYAKYCAILTSEAVNKYSFPITKPTNWMAFTIKVTLQGVAPDADGDSYSYWEGRALEFNSSIDFAVTEYIKYNGASIAVYYVASSGTAGTIDVYVNPVDSTADTTLSSVTVEFLTNRVVTVGSPTITTPGSITENTSYHTTYATNYAGSFSLRGGIMQVPNGTAANPSLTFDVTDSNTGLYWVSADNIGITAGSVPTAVFSATGARLGPATNRVAVGMGMGAGDKGIEIGYSATVIDTVTIQAIHQGTAYRDILINPAGGNLAALGSAFVTGSNVQFGQITFANPLVTRIVTNGGANNTPAISLLANGKAEHFMAVDVSTGNLVIGDTPTNYTSANVQAAANITITTAGLVGIGVTPTVNFQAQATTYTGQVQSSSNDVESTWAIYSKGTNTSARSTLRLENNDTTGGGGTVRNTTYLTANSSNVTKIGTNGLNNATQLYTVGNYALQFGTNNIARGTFLGSGEFGVGTNAPRTLIEISSNSTPTLAVTNSGYKGSNRQSNVDFYSGGDVTERAAPIARVSAVETYATTISYTGDLSFQVGSASAGGIAEAMRILSTRTVAIGTSTAVAGTMLTLQPVHSSIYYMVSTSGTLTSTHDGTSAGVQCGWFNTNTFSPTLGASLVYQTYLSPTFAAPSTKTISGAQSIYIYNNFSGNVGTITDAYGIRVTAGGSSAGTITNHYGLHVVEPAAGTNKFTGYFQGTTVAQIRAAYSSSVYTDIKTISTGNVEITPTGSKIALFKPVLMGTADLLTISGPMFYVLSASTTKKNMTVLNDDPAANIVIDWAMPCNCVITRVSVSRDDDASTSVTYTVGLENVSAATSSSVALAITGASGNNQGALAAGVTFTAGQRLRMTLQITTGSSDGCEVNAIAYGYQIP